jgi:hypothetical protein
MYNSVITDIYLMLLLYIISDWNVYRKPSYGKEKNNHKKYFHKYITMKETFSRHGNPQINVYQTYRL